VASSNTPAVRTRRWGRCRLRESRLRASLFGTAGKTLRDGWNRDDRVSRAWCSPRTVEDDAVERLAILAAEERAVQALRTRNRAEELAVGRKHIHRLPRRHVQPALLIDRGS